MNARLARLTFLALAAATACSSGARSVGARFSAPVAIVPFAGNLTKAGGGLRDYLAVASSRGDELTILDPSDEQPVLGPNAVFPLSIPTAPRPLRLAAAQLGDRDLGAADLLVVVSAGSLELQVVNTWDPSANAVDPARSVDLSGPLSAALGPGAEIPDILALAAVPGPAGTRRARVLVAASGGLLASVDFVRDAESPGVDPATLGIAPSTGGVTVRNIGVNALDLAVEPGGDRVFAATRDQLRDAAGNPLLDAAGNPVFGVLQIDATGVASDVALDAKGPTLAVAAARVRERVQAFAPRDQNAPDTFEPPDDASVPLKVYAALDPDGCGPERPIACGLATLLPSGPAFPGGPPVSTPGLADDLAKRSGVVVDPQLIGVDAMGFREPMPIPGVPVAIAIAFPPARGTSRVSDKLNPGIPLMTEVANSGAQTTTAVAVVTSTDGNVYLYDLGRAAPLNDISLALNGLPIASAAQSIPAVASAPTATVLGLSADFPVAIPAATPVVTDATTLSKLIQVTPGFTLSNDYAITWQGTLPNLVARRGTVFVDTSATPPVAYAAVQVPTGSGATPDPTQNAFWAVGAQLASAGAGTVASELGVRAGDIVDITCPSTATVEVTVVAPLLAPGTTKPAGTASVVFPGGAVQLSDIPCGLAPQLTPVTLTVRASGVVVTRGPTGQNRSVYVGRPDPFDAQNTPVTFSFQWREEHPETLVPPGAPLDAEALALARKARRVHYPVEPACPTTQPTGCFNNFPWLADPLAPGPVVAFKLGLVDIDAANNVLGASLPGARPARDTQITFSTTTGFSQASRHPVTAGVLPRGIAVFDRTKFGGHENEPVRIYATYLDDELLSFTPADASGVVRSIR